MKPLITRFINHLIKLQLPDVTKAELAKEMPYASRKQLDNLVLRAKAKGYLTPTDKFRDHQKVYRISKRMEYVSKVKSRPAPKLQVKIDQLQSVEVHSVKSHISNSHIDIVITLKLKDILEAFANKL